VNAPLRRERATRIPLAGLTEGQRAIVLEGTTDWLVALANDLCRYGPDDIERVTDEISALGRLASWLHQGQVAVPDRMVRAVIERRNGETQRLDELEVDYERELFEQDAWVALLAHFPNARTTTDEGSGRIEEVEGNP
jgi:hypothetical protein